MAYVFADLLCPLLTDFFLTMGISVLWQSNNHFTMNSAFKFRENATKCEGWSLRTIILYNQTSFTVCTIDFMFTSTLCLDHYYLSGAIISITVSRTISGKSPLAWLAYQDCVASLLYCKQSQRHVGSHQTDSLFWVLSMQSAMIVGWRARFTHREHKHIQGSSGGLSRHGANAVWRMDGQCLVPCVSNYSFLIMWVFQTVSVLFSNTHIHCMRPTKGVTEITVTTLSCSLSG